MSQPKGRYRVLRLINRFNLGGPTYNVTYLSKFLSPEYETLLAGGMKDESEASSEYIPERYGIKPIVISHMRRSINPLNDLIAYKEIKKIIKDYKPHIVHTHASKAGFLGRMAAISCNVPIIVHTFHGHVFHSYFGNFQTLLYKNIERYLAKRSTALIALSEKQKHELTDIHHIAPASKFRIVPLGFDLERFWTRQPEKRKAFRDLYGLNDNILAIGIMGRLVPIKNHSLFLKAFSHAKGKTKVKAKAFIIGDGEEKQKLFDECKELSLSFSTPENADLQADVVFTSWIKDADIATAGLDIIALSSLNEGTPVSLIEAQAAGKPVISTATGGIENVVIENVTALLSGVNDIDSFANNMLKLLNDKQLREQLSTQGREFVTKNFSYSVLVSNMQQLYDRLLAQKGL